MITQNQITEIINLSNSMKQVEISKKLNISKSLINYYINRENKIKSMKKYWNKKTLEERRKVYKTRLPYMKNYYNNRYANDESFRNKQKERSRRYYERKKI
jgi:hypothetical protein